MGFIGQHQPVVPVADLILQLLQCLAHLLRLRIALHSQFGHITGLLRAFAKIVQIAHVKRLHLESQPRKSVQRNNTRGLFPRTPRSFREQHRLQFLHSLFELQRKIAGLRLQPARQFAAAMFEPGIQMIGLLFDAGGSQSSLRSLQQVHCTNSNTQTRLLFLLVVAGGPDGTPHQLLQQPAMHIEIAHRPGFAPDLFERFHRCCGREAKRFAGFTLLALAHQVLECCLQAPRARTRVMHWIHVRIVAAFRQIFAQFRGKPPHVLKIVIHYRTDVLALADILNSLPSTDPMTYPPLSKSQPEAVSVQPSIYSTPSRAWTLLVLAFIAVYFAALFSPALLDDADATHAQAAQHIAMSGDWVTMYVNGIRYLEKPPLPYWIVAVDYHLFGYNVFATHLPMALAVLGCAWIAWTWSRRAWGDRAAFYAALAMLTSVGVFLFTRTLIPESLLTFFLLLSLYSFITGVEDRNPARFYIAYASLALALLAKGLIAPVFFVAAVVPYLILTGDWKRWRQFHLFTGFLVFLAIGAPWHILAGLANPDHGNPSGNVPSPGHVHGFFYFYFINEHFLRFLGTRFPHDYNRQPWYVYWLGQLIWLFPWSLFLPVVMRRAWRNRHLFYTDLLYDATNTIQFLDPKLTAYESSALAAHLRFRARTSLLLALYAGFILIFFAISTNQEYYTWPLYPAVLMLIAGGLSVIEESQSEGRKGSSGWLTGAHIFFVAAGLLSAVLLAWGLWESRHIPYVADIGTLMAHRGVGGYTLSMSHFFDLTGPSFAALRLPAMLAAVTFFVGPLLAWYLRRKGHSFEATASIAFTIAVILVAAHIALVRFQPMLSGQAMAQTINRITAAPANADAQLMLYGDQADGSSIIFYTHRHALLVHGASNYFAPDPETHVEVFGSSMIWGSDYPDAPHIFLSDVDLLRIWGTGERKLLFVPGDFRDHVEALLGSRLYQVQEVSDKTLYTDRPL